MTPRTLVLALLVLVSCSGETPAPPPAQTDSVLGPGSTVSLLAVAREALTCDGTISWSVVEPNGGSVTASGDYSAPACGAGFTAGTYHVQATGCTRSVAIPVTVAEDVTGVQIVCAVVQGTTCCASGGVSLPPGGTAQFYALVSYTCPGHVVFVPGAPPAACP